MLLMDSSQAGIIINNSNNVVLSVSQAISYVVILAGGGGVAGILLTLLGKIGDGWIKEFFENRKQARDLKRLAAHDITSFCIEGMHSGFRHKAGSEHHVKFRAAEIESIDSIVGKKLLEFLGAWSMHRNFIKDKPEEFQSVELAIEYRNDAQKRADELLEIAKKWAM